MHGQNHIKVNIHLHAHYTLRVFFRAVISIYDDHDISPKKFIACIPQQVGLQQS